MEAFFAKATIWRGWPNPVLIQKDGVPVVPGIADPDYAIGRDEREPEAKAL